MNKTIKQKVKVASEAIRSIWYNLAYEMGTSASPKEIAEALEELRCDIEAIVSALPDVRPVEDEDERMVVVAEFDRSTVRAVNRLLLMKPERL